MGDRIIFLFYSAGLREIFCTARQDKDIIYGRREAKTVKKTMEDMLQVFCREQGIHYHLNILPGHTKVQTNWKRTIFTAPFGHVATKRIEYYFFCFDRYSLSLRQYENMAFFGPTVHIPWDQISGFEAKDGPLEIEIAFDFKSERYHMMLSRRMRGEEWVKENGDHLLENGFFCPEGVRRRRSSG